ncbi:MAG: transglutaminase [Hyphomicrobiales bacterium]|nr:transglutaminase [Hyphomicrobiales bacterium]
MRIRIRHETHYTFDPPAKSTVQTLRMTPRNHEGQHIIGWRMDVDADCLLRASEDSFGNIGHSFSVEGPLTELTIIAEGDVETSDNAGVVRGGVERFPIQVYLRDTDLTLAGTDLRNFATDAARGNEGTLDTLHRLMTAVHETIKVDHSAKRYELVAANEILGRKSAAAADIGHVFVASARFLGIASRIVEGYYLPLPGEEGEPGGHSWAEAFVEGLGWIGFDAAHDVCPQENHIRVAMGLDRLGAAPARAARLGGDGTNVEVRIDLTPRGVQTSQRQSQS